MITFLAALCGGIISAVITLTLGQPLQHYFWTRQRQAERQLVAIDEANRLAAEVGSLLITGEDIVPRTENLYIGLGTTTANVATLFPEAGHNAMTMLNESIAAAIRLSPGMTREQRDELAVHLADVQNNAIKALYHEMGIPAPPPGQWIREYAWQPLRAQLWNRPQRLWHENGRPMLQRWRAQIRTKARRS
jgi:hypothetical protein